jgi:TonB family protein
MDLLPAYRSHREMTEPLPAIITDNDYAIGELDTGDVAAVCLHRQDVDGRTYDPTWCFEPGSPTLRITVNANSEDVLHSNPVSFQGRTIPADVKLSGGELKSIETDRPAFSAHLETIEPLTAVDDAAFVPPVDANVPISALGGVLNGNVVVSGIAGQVPLDAATTLAIPKKVNISAGVAVGMLVQKAPVHYPEDAKAAGVSGTVVLQALIDTEGHVSDIRAVSGPPMLQEAAIDSVRQWRYRPYLLNGQPVEVNTVVNVVFTLGR